MARRRQTLKAGSVHRAGPQLLQQGACMRRKTSGACLQDGTLALLQLLCTLRQRSICWLRLLCMLPMPGWQRRSCDSPRQAGRGGSSGACTDSGPTGTLCSQTICCRASSGSGSPAAGADCATVCRRLGSGSCCCGGSSLERRQSAAGRSSRLGCCRRRTLLGLPALSTTPLCRGHASVYRPPLLLPWLRFSAITALRPLLRQRAALSFCLLLLPSWLAARCPHRGSSTLHLPHPPPSSPAVHLQHTCSASLITLLLAVVSLSVLPEQLCSNAAGPAGSSLCWLLLLLRCLHAWSSRHAAGCCRADHDCKSRHPWRLGPLLCSFRRSLPLALIAAVVAAGGFPLHLCSCRLPCSSFCCCRLGSPPGLGCTSLLRPARRLLPLWRGPGITAAGLSRRDGICPGGLPLRADARRRPGVRFCLCRRCRCLAQPGIFFLGLVPPARTMLLMRAAPGGGRTASCLRLLSRVWGRRSRCLLLLLQSWTLLACCSRRQGGKEATAPGGPGAHAARPGSRASCSIGSALRLMATGPVRWATAALAALCLLLAAGCWPPNRQHNGLLPLLAGHCRRCLLPLPPLPPGPGIQRSCLAGSHAGLPSQHGRRAVRDKALPHLARPPSRAACPCRRSRTRGCSVGRAGRPRYC